MKRFLKLLKGKKGSGILTVMLAVTFLTAVGTLSMYLTYTSFQVATSDRVNKKVSYNAITCMEEIKAGMQSIVSDAIKETYKEVMPDYVFNKGDISRIFANRYFDHICNSEGIFTINKNSMGNYDDNGHYSAEAIADLIKEKRNDASPIVESVSIANNYDGEEYIGKVGNVVIEKDADNNPTGIILEGVKVTYSEQGRRSSVCADIKIGIPNIGWLMTQYAIKGIPDFSLICTGELIQNFAHEPTSDSEKNGIYRSSAYVGNISLGDNNFFEIGEGSTLISRGGISVAGGSPILEDDYDNNKTGHYRFKVAPNSTLWAGGVKIGEYSSARLLGTAYVANDLEFSGQNAFARLSGTYFGFGTGGVDNASYFDFDPESGSTKPVYQFGSSNMSSSIISNGKGSVLYLDGNYVRNTDGTIIRDEESGKPINNDNGKIEELNLAGVSFISNEGRFGSTDELFAGTVTEPASVPMGESVSGYLNQGIYYPPFGTITILEAEKTLEDLVDEEGNVTVEYFTEEVFNDEGMVVDLKYIAHNIADDTYRYVYFDEDNNLVDGEETAWGDFTPKTRARDFSEGASKMTIMTRAELSTVVDFVINTDDLSDYIPGKKFSDYGITLKPYYKPIDDDHVAVFFMLRFEDQQKANQYYADYFNASVANGDLNKIRRNLNSYINVLSGATGKIRAFTSGILPPSSDSEYSEISVPDLTDIRYLAERADFVGKIFDNYCKTLSNTEVVPDPEKPYTLANNPFDYYINSEKIDEFFTNGLDSNGDNQIDFYHRDKLTAKIVKGDYTYNGSSSEQDLCFIVVKDGNVTIKSDFSGLIICDGNIILESVVELTSSSEEVLAAYASDSVNGKEEGSLFKEIFWFDFLSQYEESVSSRGDAWNVAKLVTFSKWRKD